MHISKNVVPNSVIYRIGMLFEVIADSFAQLLIMQLVDEFSGNTFYDGNLFLPHGSTVVSCYEKLEEIGEEHE